MDRQASWRRNKMLTMYLKQPTMLAMRKAIFFCPNFNVFANNTLEKTVPYAFRFWLFQILMNIISDYQSRLYLECFNFTQQNWRWKRLYLECFNFTKQNWRWKSYFFERLEKSPVFNFVYLIFLSWNELNMFSIQITMTPYFVAEWPHPIVKQKPFFTSVGNSTKVSFYVYVFT